MARIVLKVDAQKGAFLRTHLFDEQNRLRKHVLILYNDQNTRWPDTLEVPIRPGDRITIHQAVSGG